MSRTPILDVLEAPCLRMRWEGLRKHGLKTLLLLAKWPAYGMCRARYIVADCDFQQGSADLCHVKAPTSSQ